MLVFLGLNDVACLDSGPLVDLDAFVALVFQFAEQGRVFLADGGPRHPHDPLVLGEEPARIVGKPFRLAFLVPVLEEQGYGLAVLVGAEDDLDGWVFHGVSSSPLNVP